MLSMQNTSSQASDDIGVLLKDLRHGDRRATDRLIPLVYDELHLLARRQLRRCRPGRTLNTTALVHEAFLKLFGGDAADWRDRAHFIAVAATAMRHILVDYARERRAKKRGGDAIHTTLKASKIGLVDRRAEMLALDQALDRLQAMDERLVRVVELRFFGGLTEPEVAEVLGLSDRTVRRDWRKARAFLSRALGGIPKETP